MKSFITILVCLLLSGSMLLIQGQEFDKEVYQKHLDNNKDMTKETLLKTYPLNGSFYSEDAGPYNISQSCYFDSVTQKLNLSEDELKLLKQNHFVVTERLSYNSVLGGLDFVYHKDLPVMISTDVLLHALHNSYDNMLQSVEIIYLESMLDEALRKMYEQFKLDAPAYSENEALNETVSDAELYILMARALLDTTETFSPVYCNPQEFNAVKTYVNNAKNQSTPLFTYNARDIDFSHFKPRGHYTNGQEAYFRSMMWLSFINIFLTKPPQDPTMDETDIKRMVLLSAMVNEILYRSGAEEEINDMDEIIKYFVGESDNLTPLELKSVLEELSVDNINDLTDDETLKSVQLKLKSNEVYGQKILSDIITTDPFSPETAELPISYKLFGQRFVIDSYVLHNASYDRITYQDKKVLRMMPDPLDVMFCLGNNNAIHLMEKELEKYPYGSAVDAMRYLFDAYDDAYWSNSLYNIWLKALKKLSIAENNEYTPFFMKTAAWQHEKLNSQLSSWSQLRHDNILYAKQSYTGGISCSYPYGYIEPYPAFYLALKEFASDAAVFMSRERFNNDRYELFWKRFAGIANTLLDISLTEVNGEPFSKEQTEFIQQALRVVKYGVCGEPPEYDGWITKLFWSVEEASNDDFTVADVHTQPDDEMGNRVGKVLHTAVGRFNLGVFIAPSPANNYEPTVFCGPVMSYYQFITNNFERKNDDEWKMMLWNNEAPERPEWTNIYLAGTDGKRNVSELELKGTEFTDTAYLAGGLTPIPLNDRLNLKVWYSEDELNIEGLTTYVNTRISLYDISGRLVESLKTNTNSVQVHHGSGSVMFYRITNKKHTYSGKIASFN